jgi:glycerophosphoryl diester phosphodiesterase
MHPTITAIMLAMTAPTWADLPPVEIIAHRGASHDAPENTLAAITLAWQQQADASEFDVYLTRDGKIVVIHDATTQRTTGVNKTVSQSLFSELRELDAGRWKGAPFAGEKIPTLEEMLATVPNGKKVFVEVKCGPEIVPELDRVLSASRLRPEQTPIIAFNPEVIAQIKTVRPDLPAYWLVDLEKKNTSPPAVTDLIAKAQDIRADGLDLSAKPTLDQAYAAAIQAAGLRLYVWTVNDPAVAWRMVRLGVDGITTDRPAWLREQLRQPLPQ